jgi:hypothetical protein
MRQRKKLKIEKEREREKNRHNERVGERKFDVERVMGERGTKSGRGHNGDSEKDGAKKKRRMNNEEG